MRTLWPHDPQQVGVRYDLLKPELLIDIHIKIVPDELLHKVLFRSGQLALLQPLLRFRLRLVAWRPKAFFALDHHYAVASRLHGGRLLLV